MKCFKLSFVFLVVAQLSVALFVPESNGIVARQGKGNKNQGGGNNNTAAGGNGGADPQTSTTLDPSVIQKINGKANGTGEADSLVSTNNFINFCVGNKQGLTNGQQVKAGSCNPTPMGNIPSNTNMPSCKFANPPNGADIPANTAFNVVMNIKGMETGLFTNAANTYFAAPQQLNAQGQVRGHSHVVIESLSAVDATTPTDPTVFAFFKGLNSAATGGQLTATVDKGLPAGAYRLASINTAANHQPILVPVAQRGSIDDAIYFTVGGAGGGNANANVNNANGNNGNNTAVNGNNGNNTTPANGNNKNNAGNKNGGKGGRNGRRYERRFFTWQ